MSSITTSSNSGTNQLFQQTNLYAPYVQELLQIDSQTKLQMQSDLSTEKSKKQDVTDIGTKLTTLNTTLGSFINDPLTQFSPYSATSSDSSAVSVISSDGINNPGTYNIQVSQVAKNDIALSSVFSNTGTDLSTSGTGSIDVSIGGATPVTISVNTTGLTNKDVLTNIATAINNQLGTKVNASVYQVDSNNVQLSLKSLNTGSANQISISNAQGDLAGLNTTHLYTSAQLDAKFSIDGVSFQRSSNIVNDAITGMSFQINSNTGSNIQLNVALDTQQVQKNIQSFVDQYNAVNTLIRQDTFVDVQTQQKGPLADNMTIRSMSNTMWQMVMQPVSSLSGTGISQLADIGIETQTDGSLKITDSQKLQNALKTNPQGVQNLFMASDGVATSLKSKIDSYITGSNNLLDTIKTGIDDRINRLNDQISQQDTYLQMKQKQYEDEFNQLQQVIINGQSTYNAIMAFNSQSNNTSTNSYSNTSSSTSTYG